MSGSGYAMQGAVASSDGTPIDLEKDDGLRLTLLAGVLNNEASVEETEGAHYLAQGDPTEVALLVAAAKAGIWKEDARTSAIRAGAKYPSIPSGATPPPSTTMASESSSS